MNILLLAIELYKAKNNPTSEIMFELFPRWITNYNIHSQTDFLRSIKPKNYGLKSLRYLPKCRTLYHKT